MSKVDLSLWSESTFRALGFVNESDLRDLASEPKKSTANFIPAKEKRRDSMETRLSNPIF